MDRELKRWELALLFGLLVALAAGSWLSREQADLADQVIRFHIPQMLLSILFADFINMGWILHAQLDMGIFLIITV